MFRTPILTLTPPRPSYLGWVCWKNIINLEIEDENTTDGSVASTAVTADSALPHRDLDVWTAKLSDFDDPFTLAGCLYGINDGEDSWQKYFRLAQRGQAFMWCFDNIKYSSNNPYFELLFRCIRKICLRLNNEGGDKLAAAGSDIDECRVCIQESLKHLNTLNVLDVIEYPFSITKKPKYRETCSDSSNPYLDSNFYMALFSCALIKETVEKVQKDAADLIRFAQNQEENNEKILHQLFLRIHFHVKHLDDFISFEQKNTYNPFSIYLPFVSYLEEVQRFLNAVGTACNALLTQDVVEYEKIVTKCADDYQPSLLRLLKTKGFELTSVSSSGKCHESDNLQIKPVNFVLFANDKISFDQADVKRQVELRNVLVSYSSMPQVKRTYPRLKPIEFDTDITKCNEHDYVTTFLTFMRRLCNCDFISLL